MSTQSLRVCVTGSRGFLGSHLVDRLRADGHDVTGVDDGRSACVPASASDTTMTVFSYFFLGAPKTFDHMYHLASPVGPVGLLDHAGRIGCQIVDDAQRVVDYCVEFGAKLMFVSSSEVYGANGRCDEEGVCTFAPAASARAEYALGKLTAEMIIRNTPEPALDYRIVRPFNIAGPRQGARGGFVLPRFVQQAIAGEPLTVYGDGRAVRAFTHAQDIVDGMIRIMQDGVAGPAYNLGNPGNRLSILSLARMVVNAYGGNPMTDIGFVDPHTLWGPSFAEAGDKWPGPMRARALGWLPRYDIGEIIEQVITYERERAGVVP